MIYEGKELIFNHSDQYSLQRILKSEEDKKNSSKKHEEGKSSISLRSVKKYLSMTGFGDFLDICSIFLSLFQTILYCIDTYYWDENKANSPSPIIVFQIIDFRSLKSLSPFSSFSISFWTFTFLRIEYSLHFQLLLLLSMPRCFRHF